MAARDAATSAGADAGAPIVGRLLPYLAAALAFLVFLLLIYTRKEPHLEWSAGRTVMTPFLLASFGVIAALRRDERESRS